MSTKAGVTPSESHRDRNCLFVRSRRRWLSLNAADGSVKDRPLSDKKGRGCHHFRSRPRLCKKRLENFTFLGVGLPFPRRRSLILGRSDASSSRGRSMRASFHTPRPGTVGTSPADGALWATAFEHSALRACRSRAQVVHHEHHKNERQRQARVRVPVLCVPIPAFSSPPVSEPLPRGDWHGPLTPC